MSFFKYPFFIERLPSFYPSGIEQASAWFIQLLFTGKFYAIFSFLFGLGFYLFMERTLSKGLELVPLYRRRLLALLVFGLLHLVLLWLGDILFTYAIAGFLLLTFRNKPLASIKKWIIGLFITAFILNFLFALLPAAGKYFGGDKYQLIMTEMTKAAITVYSSDSFVQIVVYRTANELPYILISMVVFIPAVLAFFLCGFYVGKRGIFKGLASNVPLFKKIRSWGFPLGVLGLLFYIVIETGLWPVHILAKDALLNATNYAASIFIFAAYIATILLSLQTSFCQKFLAPVAAAGRMALTNYLMQTIICVLLFNSFGLGLYSKVSLFQGILLTVAIYLLQVAWSNIWLHKFRYGPMEWLWRVLTYKKLQPFKIHD